MGVMSHTHQDQGGEVAMQQPVLFTPQGLREEIRRLGLPVRVEAAGSGICAEIRQISPSMRRGVRQVLNAAQAVGSGFVVHKIV